MSEKNTDNVNDQEILQELLSLVKTKDEKKMIACADAFKLAKQYNVTNAVIGRMCNKEDIKIYQCQLGCF